MIYGLKAHRAHYNDCHFNPLWDINRAGSCYSDRCINDLWLQSALGLVILIDVLTIYECEMHVILTIYEYEMHRTQLQWSYFLDYPNFVSFTSKALPPHISMSNEQGVSDRVYNKWLSKRGNISSKLIEVYVKQCINLSNSKKT